MSDTTASSHGAFGGSFLTSTAQDQDDVLTPENLDDDTRAIGRMIDEFWAREVAPALPALHRHEPGVGRALLLKASTLGLTALHVPAEYGGATSTCRPSCWLPSI